MAFSGGLRRQVAYNQALQVSGLQTGPVACSSGLLYNPPFAREVRIMLKQLSRLERTRNIIIIGFAVLMAVSLVIFYAPGRNSSNLEPARDTSLVARVGGEEITVAEVSRLKENYMQM